MQGAATGGSGTSSLEGMLTQLMASQVRSSKLGEWKLILRESSMYRIMKIPDLNRTFEKKKKKRS